MKNKNNDDLEDPVLPPALYGIKEEVYKACLNEREIIINGVIDDTVIETVCMPILAINKHDDQIEKELADAAGIPITESKYKRDPITIWIHSSGGDLDSANAVINVIENSTTPIVTVILGRAYSAGFLIFIAGHWRVCYPYSRFMIHQGLSGSSGYSKFMDSVEQAEYLHSVQMEMHDYIQSYSKITREDLDEMYEHKKDWYVGAEEAFYLGIVDQVVGRDFEEEVTSTDAELSEPEECDREDCAGCSSDCPLGYVNINSEPD